MTTDNANINADHQRTPDPLASGTAGETDFARRLVGHLDEGASGLRQGTVNRLAQARRAALEQWHPAPAPAWGLAWASALGARVTESRYFQSRYVVPLALLVLGLAGAGYWQLTVNDVADIDAGLLTSDLPIDAYLDQGFDQWLKRPSSY
jgi:hypothetical protein